MKVASFTSGISILFINLFIHFVYAYFCSLETNLIALIERCRNQLGFDLQLYLSSAPVEIDHSTVLASQPYVITNNGHNRFLRVSLINHRKKKK